MYDIDKVNVLVSAQLMTSATLANFEGCASGSILDQLCTALLVGRLDWLPQPFTNPLRAMIHLHNVDEERWHAMLFIAEGWEISTYDEI